MGCASRKEQQIIIQIPVQRERNQKDENYNLTKFKQEKREFIARIYALRNLSTPDLRLDKNELYKKRMLKEIY